MKKNKRELIPTLILAIGLLNTTLIKLIIVLKHSELF